MEKKATFALGEGSGPLEINAPPRTPRLRKPWSPPPRPLFPAGGRAASSRGRTDLFLSSPTPVSLEVGSLHQVLIGPDRLALTDECREETGLDEDSLALAPQLEQALGQVGATDQPLFLQGRTLACWLACPPPDGAFWKSGCARRTRSLRGWVCCGKGRRLEVTHSPRENESAGEADGFLPTWALFPWLLLPVN